MSTGTEMLLVAAIVLAAGVLKGSIGFGAPLVAVPLLAPLVGTRAAIVLVALPLLIANMGVLITRPVDRRAIRRFVPLLATLIPTTFLGGILLARVDIATLTIIVGAVTIAFMGITAVGAQFIVPPRLETPLSLMVGLVAGVLSGATSAPGPIFSLYLSGLGLEKRAFVYGITILLAVGNVVQVLTYWQQGRYTGNRLLGSVALIPAILLGQLLGLRIQRSAQSNRLPPRDTGGGSASGGKSARARAGSHLIAGVARRSPCRHACSGILRGRDTYSANCGRPRGETNDHS